MTAVSKNQAIAIAAKYLPPQADQQATVTAKLIPFPKIESIYIWVISFSDFIATQYELTTLGWQDNGMTSNTYMPVLPEYFAAMFNIDANSGTVLSKSASYSLLPQLFNPSTLPPNSSSILSSGLQPFELTVWWETSLGEMGGDLDVSAQIAGDEPVISLAVYIGGTEFDPSSFEFDFDYNSPSRPIQPYEGGRDIFLLPDSYRLIGNTRVAYISGVMQNGVTFSYEQNIQIITDIITNVLTPP